MAVRAGRTGVLHRLAGRRDHDPGAGWNDAQKMLIACSKKPGNARLYSCVRHAARADPDPLDQGDV
jgi:hypothetical protein